MATETPTITAAFLIVSFDAHHVRRSALISTHALAALTNSSTEFWDKLVDKGTGPTPVYDKGSQWFVLADVQEWLVENVCDKDEVSDD